MAEAGVAVVGQTDPAAAAGHGRFFLLCLALARGPLPEISVHVVATPRIRPETPHHGELAVDTVVKAAIRVMKVFVSRFKESAVCEVGVGR